MFPRLSRGTLVTLAPFSLTTADRAELGRRNLAIAEKMLDSLSLYPFRAVEGMSATNYSDLIAAAKNELRDPQYQLYYQV